MNTFANALSKAGIKITDFEDKEVNDKEIKLKNTKPGKNIKENKIEEYNYFDDNYDGMQQFNEFRDC